MNESTLTQLRILVEQAVRPVQASTYRKRKMREELLAHVNAAFEEEAARLGDDRLAVERTEQRFGNPAELTAQLQEAISPSDRWARVLERVFTDTGVSPLRLALQYALLTLLFPGAFLLIAYFVQGRMVEWPIVVAGISLAFIGVLLIAGMRDAMFGSTGRSWRKAALIGAASWLLIPGLTFALCLTFSGDWHSSLLNVLPILPVGVLTPATLIYPARQWAVHVRSRLEWARLQID